MPARTNIGVLRGVVAKLILPEETACHRGSTLWLWHMGHEPGFLAGRDVLGPKITLVGHDIDFLDVKNLARGLGGLLQQAHVQNIVRYRLLHDHLVFGIDRDLRIVANANFRMRRHGAAVGIGE